MAAGPGEDAEQQTSSWITTGLHESVTSLAGFGVPILHPTRTPDEAAARAEAVQRLCGSGATRAAAVRRLAARLRRNEHPPATLKRAAWRVEHVLGSPLRRRGLWPAK